MTTGPAAGIRPSDLFGAITNEAKLPPKMIGAIEIGDRFSLVEVAGEFADKVMPLVGRRPGRGGSRLRRPGRVVASSAGARRRPAVAPCASR